MRERRIPAVGRLRSRPKERRLFFLEIWLAAYLDESRCRKSIGNTGNLLHWTTVNSIEIAGSVLTSVLTRLFFGRDFGAFTYEERRGRESNPRIEFFPK
jgi:hypothetical protein